MLLYCFGLRAGELLNLRIGDIDFAESTIAIRRRANDKTDPRVYQPLVKTCERKLIADTKLMFEISDYIMNDRRKIKILTNMTSCLLLIRKENSRATYFIFFISQSGECCSSILLTSRGLTGHKLRHTWNYEFSKAIDKNQDISDEKSNKSVLISWDGDRVQKLQ